MEFNEIYRAVVKLYLENGSVKETAAILHISTVKARRILITEGLWQSKTSKEIGALYQEGYSCSEIAEKLFISIKNVQAYIPYSRGTYGETDTKDSIKSSIYREKKESLAKTSALPRTEKNESKVIELKNFIKAKPVSSAEDNPQMEFGKSIPFKPLEDESFELKLELVHRSYDEDYERLSDMDSKLYSELLKYAKAKEGISRTVIVPGSMTLHSLHYLIQKAFGFLNGHLHAFSLTQSEFDRITDGSYSKWRLYQGALFAMPQEDMPADTFFDDDYAGERSFNNWLKKKYQGPYISYCASETYLHQMKEIADFDKFIAKIFKLPKKSLSSIKLNDIYKNAILGSFNSLLERLTLSELLMPNPGTITEDIFKSQISSSIKRAVENLNGMPSDEKKELNYYIKKYLECYEDLVQIKDNTYEFITKKHPLYEVVQEYEDRLKFLQDLIWPAVNRTNPKLEPFTDKLLYEFDFGDGWLILINCNRVISGEIEAPKCIDADGLNLIQDSGGIYGYVDTLKQIHGCEGPDEQENAYNWARYMGYTGKKSKPEKIL